jgi:glucosamine--fructose-6-phosphate aminotransferase (isomerizing)
VSSVILVGLEKLEYRGYDSAGIALVKDGQMVVRKTAGRIKDLQDILEKDPITGSIGIGHTRWATHGRPTERNAHPHTDCQKRIAVAHNGIIENHVELRKELREDGHTLLSETDSELIAHLIEKNYEGSLEEAVRKAAEKLDGSFALAVLCADEPDVLVGARKDSPLVVGIGEREVLLSSDIPAILSITKKILILEDREIAVLRREGWKICDFEGNPVERVPSTVEWDAGMAEKEGYEHFMLKEIHQQPAIFRENLTRYVRDGSLTLLKDFNLRRLLLDKRRILIQACGTSLHAGMVGKYLLEKFAKLHTEVDFSSEFRYREPVIDRETLVITISQSGETADTLAGLRMVAKRGLEVLSIVNVVDSSIARESDYVLYTNAGPEVGVASTKAYIAQLLTLTLLALELGNLRGFISEDELSAYTKELRMLPDKMNRIIEKSDLIEEIAEAYSGFNNFVFLGRDINYPTALEGALKLKEVSYIHAIGYAAGEMKHGPLALVDENLPVVVINPRSEVYEKVLGNMMEVLSRSGKVIGLATDGDEKICEATDHVLYVPEALPIFSPILSVIPLQLLAYYTAILRGCDVDKPRNLAKSVTVE